MPDYDVNDDGIDDRMQQDPGQLAEMTTRMHDQNPNILEQLLGKGGTGSFLDNPTVKIAIAGITAFATRRLRAAPVGPRDLRPGCCKELA